MKIVPLIYLSRSTFRVALDPWQRFTCTRSISEPFGLRLIRCASTFRAALDPWQLFTYTCSLSEPSTQEPFSRLVSIRDYSRLAYEACGPALQKLAALIVAEGAARALEDDFAISIHPNGAVLDVPKHNPVFSKQVCSMYSMLQEAPYALIYLPVASPILSRG
jgi:hypothetical protein